MFPNKTKVITVTLISSNLKFGSAIDLTSVAQGRFYVNRIVLKTDSTGLAGGTNFQVKSTNAKGLANILVETVANLGANKTIDLSNASVTKIPTILESGAKIQVQNTVANGTGAGTIDIYLELEAIDYGSRIN